MNTIIWVITASLWFEGSSDIFKSEYQTHQFQNKFECHEYMWENKADMVLELFEKHIENEKGEKLKTWGFFCETRWIQLDEV